MRRIGVVFASIALAAAGMAGPAHGALSVFTTVVGTVGVSSDGFGATSESGSIQASVPVGSTVLSAFLYSATNTTLATPIVTLDGTAVVFGPRVPNPTTCCDLASFRADVTGIVKPTIDAGPGGVYSFDITEAGAGFTEIDGEALVVIFSNPLLPVSTVAILDGFSAVGGDTATVTFVDPLDPTAPGFFAEMRIGDSFSCCDQTSTVVVNGTTITENAGNFDDGAVLSDGSLFTMGGFDDPFSPLLPSYADDHERYSLVPQITLGDTTITVATANPTADDNIFLEVFHLVGEADVTVGVPLPSTLLLLGVGVAGLTGLSRTRRRK